MQLSWPAPSRVVVATVALFCTLSLGAVAYAVCPPVRALAASQAEWVELTGYSWQDNTPPGSAEICCSVIHSRAGGTGTYDDPITVAVPGSGRSMQTPAGTRAYIPKLRRYVIVEDSGASPKSLRRFDVWVGGQGYSKRSSDACMDSFTGRAQAILHPRRGYPVTVGPLTGPNGCRI